MMQLLTRFALILPFLSMCLITFGQPPPPPSKSSAILDSITAEPNPFYGPNSNPKDGLPHQVTLKSLPGSCQIDFYTLKGDLVRTHLTAPDQTEWAWDLKNENGIPIASGLYLVHIKAGNLGERVLKIFVVMPGSDGPTTF